MQKTVTWYLSQVTMFRFYFTLFPKESDPIIPYFCIPFHRKPGIIFLLLNLLQRPIACGIQSFVCVGYLQFQHHYQAAHIQAPDYNIIPSVSSLPVGLDQVFLHILPVWPDTRPLNPATAAAMVAGVSSHAQLNAPINAFYLDR